MSDTGPCVRCGEITGNRLGNVFICQPCYEVRSSCCPEFGPDDLASKSFDDAGPEDDQDRDGGVKSG